MKHLNLTSKFLLSFICGWAFSTAFATTALWDGPGYNGSWSIFGSGAGWTGTTVPNGIGDVAQFDNNSFFGSGGTLYLTTDTSGTISGSSPIMNITLGRMEQTGPTSGRGFVLHSPSSGISSITFDVLSGNAAIQNNNTGDSEGGVIFNVDIALNDDLDVSVNKVYTGTKDGIIFNQLVTGSGAINKSGAGLIRFGDTAGANTFSGGLNITNGEVIAEKSGALGTGNLTIQQESDTSTAAFSIMDGISDALSSTSTISLFSNTGNFATLNLGLGVNQSISGLFFDGVAQSTGSWGATGSGATFENDDWFSGSGVVNVIPEPSSIILLGLGFGLMMVFRRNRQ